MRTPMLAQLLEFLDDGARAHSPDRPDPAGTRAPSTRRRRYYSNNPTLQDDVMMVYARRATCRTLAGCPVVTLDIASVRVKERLRGRGHFTEMLTQLVATARVDAIFVENVHNERLAARLVRDQWFVYNPEYFAPSFWRWTAHRAARTAGRAAA
jgi:hypothetical protein